MFRDAAPAVLKPGSVEEIQEILRTGQRVWPRGGGSKPALSTPLEGWASLDMAGISGIVEYDPDELTLAARAGTPISLVNQILEQHHQYLPFDPILVKRGATLGGSVASGASGPGRYHYGGVRDFLLGMHFVSGEGQLVSSGGKVVKNAAGFDLPKLMVGSLGRLGVIAEVTFKVFPHPEAYATLSLSCAELEEALQVMGRIATARLDVEALDLERSEKRTVLWTRVSGLAQSLPPRIERLRALLGESQVIQGSDDRLIWERAREMAWVPEGWTLLKVPLTPGSIPALEAKLVNLPVIRRYSAGGQVAWLALKDPPLALKGLFEDQGLSAMVLFGPPGVSLLGKTPSETFYQRVKQALDPVHRLVEA